MCKRSSFRSYIKYIYYVNATVVFLQGGGAAGRRSAPPQRVKIKA